MEAFERRNKVNETDSLKYERVFSRSRQEVEHLHLEVFHSRMFLVQIAQFSNNLAQHYYDAGSHILVVL